MTTFGGGYHLNGAFYINGVKGATSATVTGMVIVTYVGSGTTATYAGVTIPLSVGQYLPAGVVVTASGDIFVGAAFTN